MFENIFWLTQKKENKKLREELQKGSFEAMSRFLKMDEQRQKKFLRSIEENEELIGILTKPFHPTGYSLMSRLNDTVLRDVLGRMKTYKEFNELLIYSRNKTGQTEFYYLSSALQDFVLLHVGTNEDVIRFVRSPNDMERHTIFYYLDKEQQDRLINQMITADQLYRLLTGVKDELKHTDFYYLTNEQKLKVVLQMNHSKQVFDLFRSVEDKFGKYTFYHMPYQNFKKIVFEKFPEMNTRLLKKTTHLSSIKGFEKKQKINGN